VLCRQRSYSVCHPSIKGRDNIHLVRNTDEITAT
jgi:hypothetical protein